MSAQDVYEEFKKKIKIIVDGGQSIIGIESPFDIHIPSIQNSPSTQSELAKQFSPKQTPEQSLA